MILGWNSIAKQDKKIATTNTYIMSCFATKQDKISDLMILLSKQNDACRTYWNPGFRNTTDLSNKLRVNKIGTYSSVRMSALNLAHSSSSSVSKKTMVHINSSDTLAMYLECKSWNKLTYRAKVYVRKHFVFRGRHGSRNVSHSNRLKIRVF